MPPKGAAKRLKDPANPPSENGRGATPAVGSGSEEYNPAEQGSPRSRIPLPLNSPRPPSDPKGKRPVRLYVEPAKASLLRNIPDDFTDEELWKVTKTPHRDIQYADGISEETRQIITFCYNLYRFYRYTEHESLLLESDREA